MHFLLDVRNTLAVFATSIMKTVPKNMPGHGEIAFVVNAKAKGKVHKVVAYVPQLPSHKQQVKCGWQLKQATSLVFCCAQLKFGALCNKCFPEGAAKEMEGEPEDPIED